jgi:methyl-accepting chemotaxis protein
MAIYSVAEFLIERPGDWQNFLLHHLLHVALIGVAVWISSMLVIRRFVIEPVDHIFVHLRRVAAGRLEYLDCTVRAREVGGVVASVNHLISRLRRVPDPDAASQALDHLRSLREQLKESSHKLGNDVVPVMRLVTALEGDLLDLLQLTENPQESGRRRTQPDSVTEGSRKVITK